MIQGVFYNIFTTRKRAINLNSSSKPNIPFNIQNYHHYMHQLKGLNDVMGGK
uniref:Uncharacterized protein n=1 Tax=Solanum tuberosum TaxID=4113 RepID=M1BEZ9_SOLTU